MLVFIDESGDPGFKVSRGSSPVFTAVLVAFRDRAQAAPTQAAISNLAARLKITPEFKFNKCRPEVRDAFFNAVAPFDFCVRAIVVKKEKIYSPHLRTNKEAFYNFFVRSMLRFDNGLLQSAKVVIDGSGDRQFKQELAGYFRRALPPGRIEKRPSKSPKVIDWFSLPICVREPSPVRIEKIEMTPSAGAAS
jgi:hypothetical protein